MAALLTRPARDVAALATRLGATARAVSAALRLPSIAPLVVLDAGELRAVPGATSATQPHRQRLALARVVASRKLRRPARSAPAAPPRAAPRPARSTPAPPRAQAAPRPARLAAAAPPRVRPAPRARTDRAPGELVAVVRATDRLWRRAHLNYDEAREVGKQVRARLELHRPIARRGVPERLGQADAGRLLAAAYRAARTRGGGTRSRGLLVKTLLLSGARVSEFVHLRAEDLLVEESQIRIRRGKGGKSRVVPLLPEHAHELRTHLGRRRVGWLFETPAATRYTPRRVQQIVREVADAAGIVQRVYPHLLRHTVAQHLLERGMSLEELRKFLGHDDIKTTQIYAEATLGMVADSYRRALGGGVSSSWAGAGVGLVAPIALPSPRVARGAARAPGVRRGQRAASGRSRSAAKTAAEVVEPGSEEIGRVLQVPLPHVAHDRIDGFGVVGGQMHDERRPLGTRRRGEPR